MRAAIITVVLLFGIISVQALSAQETQSGNGGMSAAEFRDLANSLPKLPGSIQAIRLFRAPGTEQTTSAAFATFSEQTGWQISIFDSPAGHKFQLEWQSGKLDDSFSVSDSSELKVFQLGQQDAVEFEGCAPHVCPDVFSILIYVPSKRTAFTVKYVWGKVSYSPALGSPENAQFKSALDQLVAERRKQ